MTSPAQAGDDFVAADIRGLFESATVTFDGKAKRVTYRASEPVAEIRAAARGLELGAFQASIDVRDLPAEIDVNFGNDRYLFDPRGGRIGSITAIGSNTGQLVTRPGLHLYGRVDLSSDRYEISASLAGVGLLEYAKAGDTMRIAGSVDVQAQPVDLDFEIDDLQAPADDAANEFRVSALGRISKLPSSLAFRADNDRVTYSANDSIDARLDAAAGWTQALATTPTPSERYGISVTDGVCDAADGCIPSDPAGNERLLCSNAEGQCYALRASYNFDGLARTVDVNTRDPEDQPLAVIGGLRPRSGFLQIRADLQHLLDEPVTAELRQDGVVADAVLRFGPVSIGRAGTGPGLPIAVRTDHDADMGRLRATLSMPDRQIVTDIETYSAPRGYVDVSNVPARLNVRAGFGSTTQVAVKLSSPVAGVKAVVRATSPAAEPPVLLPS